MSAQNKEANTVTVLKSNTGRIRILVDGIEIRDISKCNINILPDNVEVSICLHLRPSNLKLGLD